MADKFPDPKVGDPVACYGLGRGRDARRPFARATIERVTATQIVVNGQKYKRTTGYRITSDKWDSTFVIPWDAALDALLAEADAERAAAERAAALLQRLADTTSGLQHQRTRYGIPLRKWSALELERLHALVLTFEDGAAALKATLEPDFVPESKS